MRRPPGQIYPLMETKITATKFVLVAWHNHKHNQSTLKFANTRFCFTSAGRDDTEGAASKSTRRLESHSQDIDVHCERAIRRRSCSQTG